MTKDEKRGDAVAPPSATPAQSSDSNATLGAPGVPSASIDQMLGDATADAWPGVQTYIPGRDQTAVVPGASLDIPGSSETSSPDGIPDVVAATEAETQARPLLAFGTPGAGAPDVSTDEDHLLFGTFERLGNDAHEAQEGSPEEAAEIVSGAIPLVPVPVEYSPPPAAQQPVPVEKILDPVPNDNGDGTAASLKNRRRSVEPVDIRDVVSRGELDAILERKPERDETTQPGISMPALLAMAREAVATSTTGSVSILPKEVSLAPIVGPASGSGDPTILYETQAREIAPENQPTGPLAGVHRPISIESRALIPPAPPPDDKPTLENILVAELAATQVQIYRYVFEQHRNHFWGSPSLTYYGPEEPILVEASGKVDDPSKFPERAMYQDSQVFYFRGPQNNLFPIGYLSNAKKFQLRENASLAFFVREGLADFIRENYEILSLEEIDLTDSDTPYDKRIGVAPVNEGTVKYSLLRTQDYGTDLYFLRLGNLIVQLVHSGVNVAKGEKSLSLAEMWDVYLSNGNNVALRNLKNMKLGDDYLTDDPADFLVIEDQHPIAAQRQKFLSVLRAREYTMPIDEAALAAESLPAYARPTAQLEAVKYTPANEDSQLSAAEIDDAEGTASRLASAFRESFPDLGEAAQTRQNSVLAEEVDFEVEVADDLKITRQYRVPGSQAAQPALPRTGQMQAVETISQRPTNRPIALNEDDIDEIEPADASDAPAAIVDSGQFPFNLDDVVSAAPAVVTSAQSGYTRPDHTAPAYRITPPLAEPTVQDDKDFFNVNDAPTPRADVTPLPQRAPRNSGLAKILVGTAAVVVAAGITIYALSSSERETHVITNSTPAPESVYVEATQTRDILPAPSVQNGYSRFFVDAYELTQRPNRPANAQELVNVISAYCAERFGPADQLLDQEYTAAQLLADMTNKKDKMDAPRYQNLETEFSKIGYRTVECLGR